jgi:hypothetical protein
MERANESFRMDQMSRVITAGLAVLVTSLIFTTTTVILTAGAGGTQSAVSQVAQAPAVALPKA